MNFYKHIKRICDYDKNSEYGIFFDMDGVLTNYDFNDKDDLIANTPNIYLKKKPIIIISEIVNKLMTIPNLQVMILSRCNYKEQAEEKNKWLHKYLPKIEDSNIYIITKESKEFTREQKNISKGLKIESIISERKFKHVFLVDDDHQILKGAKQILEDKISIFHVSSLLI